MTILQIAEVFANLWPLASRGLDGDIKYRWARAIARTRGQK
jgi:hypothetical protein